MTIVPTRAQETVLHRLALQFGHVTTERLVPLGTMKLLATVTDDDTGETSAFVIYPDGRKVGA